MLTFIDAAQRFAMPDALSHAKREHRQLYREVRALFTGVPEECWPRCVLIDDVSMLVSLSDERGTQVIELIQYLQILCSEHQVRW
jgi:hypothetical protein